MPALRILISGCGIAGPALAFWLTRFGVEPTLVERAPRPRESGYMIDIWGIGYEMLGRMGLLDRIRAIGYDIEELRVVSAQGKKIASVKGETLRRAMGDRFFSVLRGDLARGIYNEVEARAECLFGDSVRGIEQDDGGVDVEFKHAAPRRFDLVVGADGLHSVVRELVFGPEADFETFLGYQTAGFITDGYAHRDENAYVSHTVPGRQVARYSLRDNRTGFFLIFTDNSRRRLAPHDITAQKSYLREKFQDTGWEAPEVLAALDGCDDLYFDVVSQIHMDSWSRGRVVLLGDAACCPSLLAGEGSAFAMTGAYLLAYALSHDGVDHRAAFARFEGMFKPFVTARQKSARTYGSWFAPKTRASLAFRNMTTRLISAPVLGTWMMRRMLSSDLVLPEMEAG